MYKQLLDKFGQPLAKWVNLNNIIERPVQPWYKIICQSTTCYPKSYTDIPDLKTPIYHTVELSLNTIQDKNTWNSIYVVNVQNVKQYITTLIKLKSCNLFEKA